MYSVYREKQDYCKKFGNCNFQFFALSGFVPDTLDTSIYDEVLAIENEDAFTEGRAFTHNEGVLVGISSGAALKAAKILAERPENKGKVIVALLPDNGDSYLSTALFSD